MTEGFIPTHGGYRMLLSYQRAEIVYDATVHFCARFFKRGDHTVDQMIQGAGHTNGTSSRAVWLRPHRRRLRPTSPTWPGKTHLPSLPLTPSLPWLALVSSLPSLPLVQLLLPYCLYRHPFFSLSFPISLCHSLFLSVIPYFSLSFPFSLCHSLFLSVIPCISLSFPRKRESKGDLMKQPAVYILASRPNGTLYTGVTGDLLKRVWEHKNDFVEGFTKRYCVHNLVYFVLNEDMNQAIRREKQIKKWNRAWKVELIEQNSPQWLDLWPSLTGGERLDSRFRGNDGGEENR